MHNFSPLITLLFLWMFLANISSQEPPLAHRSLSPKQQSVCTQAAKPWPFLSILLTRMLSSLVCSFLSWRTYFRRLVVVFQIWLWWDHGPWGSASSRVFEEPLQRLCEIRFDDCRHRTPILHCPSGAEKASCMWWRGFNMHDNFCSLISLAFFWWVDNHAREREGSYLFLWVSVSR